MNNYEKKVKERPVFNDHGNAVAVDGVTHDITQHKQDEKRYRILFDNAPDSIFTLKGLDFRINDFNKKALETFKSAAGEFIGRTPYELSPPTQYDGQDSKEKALNIIAELVQNKQPMVFNWQHKRLNGELFDAEVSLSILEQEPEIVLQAIIRDISKRKQLDNQIRLMQHWVEHSVDLFFWVREDAQILYVNQAVCQALGYDLEEMCTLRVGDFDLEITREAWSGFTQTLREQGSYYFETRLRRKDGTEFPAEITANILEFEGKDYFFAYGKDISKRVEADKDRKTLESQLRQAQKMEAIGALAGGIAHDFNNILSAIFGYAELVKDSLKDDTHAYQMQNQVLGAAKRARDLVEQILVFSRQADHKMGPVEPHLIVNEALKLLRASIPTTIKIKNDISSDSGYILADPTQIHQIIMNLCTNSYHAMRDTGGIIDVTLQNLEITEDNFALEDLGLDAGDYIKLEVYDTGHGMAPATLEKIFNPYFTTKSKGEGTGLGLSVVHGIVKSIGGQIHVTSEENVGTNFQIYFPKLEIELSEEEKKRGDDVPGGHERIMVVDDEPAILDITRAMLEHLGYHVETFQDNRDAIQFFAENFRNFDLVITDLTMPNMTGIELAKKISGIRSDMPIILCTGFSDSISQSQAQSMGIEALLTKPILRTDLARTVRTVLDQQDGG